MTAPADVGSCILQLVFSRAASRRSPRETAIAAIEGGVDLIQLREKGIPTSQGVAIARELLEATLPRGVPLLINDDVEIAARLLPDVAGVHLGQGDAPVERARRRLGEAAWIGLSTHSAQQLALGLRTSATHFGLGACAPSLTKLDSAVLAESEIERACGLATRPVFAIGGITAERVATLRRLGVRRVAVGAAIASSPDPAAAAAAIRSALEAGA